MAIVLIGMQGFDEVSSVMATAGWGVLWVPAIWVLPMYADTLAWQRLIEPHARVSFRLLFWVRWISDSVNNLMPVPRVGGLLRAWLVHRAGGLSGALAGGTVVVDVTVAVLTQIAFALIGLAILISLGASGLLVQTAVIGVGLLAGALLAFFFVQKAGIFGFSGRLVEAVVSRAGWATIVDDSRKLDDEIRALYTRHRPLMACIAWRLMGWLTGALEVWAALWVLGHPVGFAEALMLESLIQAVRSTAFMVPGALGVQEGGLILLGSVIGLSPEVALALSLIKRIRELLLGVPGLVAWQLSELHSLWVSVSSRGMRD